MKNKQLYLNMAANGFVILVNIVITFWFTPIVVDTLGKESYSFYSLANNFVSYISIITAAFNSMAGRFITVKFHQEDIEGANIYFNTVLFSNFAIVAFLVMPLALVMMYLQNILNIPQDIISSVKLLFGYIFLTWLFSLFSSIFEVSTFCSNRLDLKAGVNITQSILKIGLIICLFTLMKPQLEFIGLANLIVILFSIAINYHLLKKLLPNIKISVKKFHLKAVGKLMGAGIWNAVNNLSLVLISGLDLLLANIFFGASLAGVYAISQTLPTYIKTFMGLIVVVFVPQFTIKYARNKKNELLGDINFSVKILGIIIGIPTSILLVLGMEFYSLWVPSQNSSELYLLSLMIMMPLFVSGNTNSLYNIFTVANKLKIPALVLLITGAMTTAGTLILVQYTSLGLFAIPLASGAISILRNLIFTPVYAAKCLDVKTAEFYPGIFKGLISIAIFSAVLFVFKQFIHAKNWTNLIICAISSVSVALFPVLMVQLNNFERKSLFRMISRKFKRISS